MQVLYHGGILIKDVHFYGESKTGEPGEKPSEQGENQQQTQPTYGNKPELILGHFCERRVLSPLYHSCSPNILLQSFDLHQ